LTTRFVLVQFVDSDSVFVLRKTSQIVLLNSDVISDTVVLTHRADVLCYFNSCSVLCT